MPARKNKRAANNEGTTPRKRSDGRWEARITIPNEYTPKGKQKFRYVYGKTQAECSAKKKKILADLQDKKYKTPNKIKLGEWLDTWSRDYWVDKSASTRQTYSDFIRLHI